MKHSQILRHALANSRGRTHLGVPRPVIPRISTVAANLALLVVGHKFKWDFFSLIFPQKGERGCQASPSPDNKKLSARWYKSQFLKSIFWSAIGQPLPPTDITWFHIWMGFTPGQKFSNRTKPSIAKIISILDLMTYNLCCTSILVLKFALSGPWHPEGWYRTLSCPVIASNNSAWSEGEVHEHSLSLMLLSLLSQRRQPVVPDRLTIPHMCSSQRSLCVMAQTIIPVYVRCIPQISFSLL